jgi:uncharacterized flavoprotein (TIGR03862 family)
MTQPTASIIGGGPAGLIAAEILSRADVAVTVYDRMASLGRKFLMAGRGGLNLTHSEPTEQFLTRYGAARSFLEPLIGAFSPTALRQWAEELGQPTFVGSSGRVFPESMKASPLLRAWLGRLRSQGVAFRTACQWRGWAPDGSLLFRHRDGSDEAIAADVTLLALGGASWPRLGSDGGWAGILAERGVAISTLRPANCGFHVAWSEIFRERFQGQPIKNLSLSFGGRSRRGEMMITGYGLEGGAIYALSSELRDAIEAEGRAVLRLDLCPDFVPSELLRRLSLPQRRQSQSNFLRRALGLSPLAIGLMREAAGPALPDQPAQLAALIRSLPLTLTAPAGLERAISTAGGIKLEELDEGLMLKRLPGVFAAGEMLDWEAPTGGYLLQASFATGFAAAQGAVKYVAKSGGTR